ncbi:MAG: internal scaffolding protein [Microviridae sp.]|nr:MAG: internal scaffolding protein [Microviridae sp.]
MLKSPKRLIDRKKSQTNTGSESLVQQNQAAACNINTMMKKYQSTGVLNTMQKQAQYGDFSTANDFREAKQKVLDAEENFNKLPSHIRERFNHSPFFLLDFMLKEENREEAIELGFIEEPMPLEEQIVPVNDNDKLSEKAATEGTE